MQHAVFGQCSSKNERTIITNVVLPEAQLPQSRVLVLKHSCKTLISFDRNMRILRKIQTNQLDTGSFQQSINLFIVNGIAREVEGVQSCECAAQMI